MKQGQLGAALLLSLVVVTVVSSVAATMVWQHWRSVQSESAERARSQAHWILMGALDWGRLILREDARGSQIDHLGEPWAVPLQEARLSTFLTDGREGLDDVPALQAFVSGSVVDAQSRLNLRNLVVNGVASTPALLALQRVCEAAGLPGSTADRIAQGAQRSWVRRGGESSSPEGGALLAPERLSDLVWWGLTPDEIERLRPWAILLPVATPLNVNTATVELLAVMIPGADRAAAQRLAQARSQSPFRSIDQALALLPPDGRPNRGEGLSVQSSFFELNGRLRLGSRQYSERLLVERRQAEVLVLHRERPLAQASNFGSLAVP